MTQRNLSKKQKETHKHSKQTWDCQGGQEVGEERAGQIKRAALTHTHQPVPSRPVQSRSRVRLFATPWTAAKQMASS